MCHLVISHHTQCERQISGSISASETSVENKTTFIVIAKCCKSLKQGACSLQKPNSTPRSWATWEEAASQCWAPFFSILSSPSLSYSHIWIGIEEVNYKRHVEFLSNKNGLFPLPGYFVFLCSIRKTLRGEMNIKSVNTNLDIYWISDFKPLVYLLKNVFLLHIN